VGHERPFALQKSSEAFRRQAAEKYVADCQQGRDELPYELSSTVEGTLCRLATLFRPAVSFLEVITMDWNRIEGNWKQAKGKVKEKWGQLTDDDLSQVNGKRDQLEGKIQQRYGLAKDMVRKDIDDWLKSQP
jgi:uncharacterized protein YjbJ (UPF0337 family)